ncbi:MAG: hypothetical protein ACT4QG_09775 [Sporichthyaceae bacterium]
MANRFLPTVAVLALSLGQPWTGPSALAAADPADTHCTAEFEVTLSPGFSATPSSGTFASDGESGTMTCDGPIDGARVTGPGTRGEAGRYGVGSPSSCLQPLGEAEWTIQATLPTEQGKRNLRLPVSGTYGPLQGGGPLGGTFASDRAYGTFTITPVEGDCVTAPITRVRLTCDEWIVNGRPDG